METPTPSDRPGGADRPHGAPEHESQSSEVRDEQTRGQGSFRGKSHRGGTPRWAEHLMLATDAFAQEMRGCVPGGFSEHARGSVREALLAVRSLLDAGIERLEEDEHKPAARKIEVE